MTGIPLGPPPFLGAMRVYDYAPPPGLHNVNLIDLSDCAFNRIAVM